MAARILQVAGIAVAIAGATLSNAYIAILGLAVLLVGTYWGWLRREGRLSFWQLASQFPDEAYDWCLSETDSWVVLESPKDVPPPREIFAGPFQLAVPKLGWRTIKIYGRLGAFEESQHRFAKSREMRHGEEPKG